MEQTQAQTTVEGDVDSMVVPTQVLSWNTVPDYGEELRQVAVAALVIHKDQYLEMFGDGPKF